MLPLSIPHPSHLRASHSSRGPPHSSHSAGFHCCLECWVLVVAFGWPVPHLPLRAVASTASDCVVSAGPASFRIVVAPGSSLAIGSGFHLYRLRLVLRLPYVCILSTHQTKINRFSRKPIEVSRNSRFANENAGKKIAVFLARWLGSPVSPKW